MLFVYILFLLDSLLNIIELVLVVGMIVIVKLVFNLLKGLVLMIGGA